MLSCLTCGDGMRNRCLSLNKKRKLNERVTFIHFHFPSRKWRYSLLSTCEWWWIKLAMEFMTLFSKIYDKDFSIISTLLFIGTIFEFVDKILTILYLQLPSLPPTLYSSHLSNEMKVFMTLLKTNVSERLRKINVQVLSSWKVIKTLSWREVG